MLHNKVKSLEKNSANGGDVRIFQEKSIHKVLKFEKTGLKWFQ